MTKRKKALLITGIVVVVLAAAFFIRDYLMFQPVDWVEGDVSQWSGLFPDDPAYALALGLDSSGSPVPVFKDPLAALEQFKIDNAAILEHIAEDYDLKPLSKYNYKKYMETEMYSFFFYTFSESISEEKYIW